MFIKATPESAGISSKSVLKLLKVIDDHELSAHSILIARGNKLFCEAYWKPFDRVREHRMYSQTKSFVGLAVRLLAEDGAISLEDPIIRCFPDKLPEQIHPYLEKLTIRNMLMMRTCFDDHAVNWFCSDTDDRVRLYFSQQPSVYPGTQYDYDSMGSFVLCALVERLTGKIFLDYLREKCLREIGFSETAHCLRCPGGYSWGDSALLCTPMDMLRYGRFIGRFGEWEGRQIIRRGIIEEAIRDHSDLGISGLRSFSHGGYAGQFWNFRGNAVGFNGMHDQVTLYDPDTDITFTCTSGNQRGTASRELMISYLYTEIIETAGERREEDPAAFAELSRTIDGLTLIAARGNASSPLEREISGKIFRAGENPMGISEYSLFFGEDYCDFHYTNAQGQKSIRLGRLRNSFGFFPQTGYSAAVGGKTSPGNQYACASSFAWGSENQLNMKIQIIDDYIGNLYVVFAYKDGCARIRMRGDAENFLREYNGNMNAFAEKTEAGTVLGT